MGRLYYSSHHQTVSYRAPATDDAGMMTYAAMALSSCTGTALLLRRRKRED